MQEMQKKQLSKELKALDDIINSKGKNTAIFKLKDNILGSKKTSQDQEAITDPDTGELVYTPSEIKKYH